MVSEFFPNRLLSGHLALCVDTQRMRRIGFDIRGPLAPIEHIVGRNVDHASRDVSGGAGQRLDAFDIDAMRPIGVVLRALDIRERGRTDDHIGTVGR